MIKLEMLHILRAYWDTSSAVIEKVQMNHISYVINMNDDVTDFKLRETTQGTNSRLIRDKSQRNESRVTKVHSNSDFKQDKQRMMYCFYCFTNFAIKPFPNL